MLCVFILVKTTSWNKIKEEKNSASFLLRVLILLRYPFLPLKSFFVSDLVSASRGNRGSTAISRSFVCLGLSEHPNLFLPAFFFVLKTQRLDE